MILRRRFLQLLGFAALLAAACGGTGALAQQQADASGQVRRVDAAAGKVTIKHGKISALELPAMTLVYEAEPPTLLQNIKPGDKVRFTAARKGDRYVVTAITAQ